MPKVNIYLPDELAKAVKDAGISVSPVCQRALVQQVAKGGNAMRVNISLPTLLYRRVKEAGISVSQVCQRALEEELQR
jgi:post-segregation antitoxin (ccd killing protein)